MVQEMVKMKTKIGAIILNNGKILSVRKRDSDIYIMPGGGPEGTENHEETLKRELKEELNVESANFKLFDSFVEPAIFEPGNIVAHVYYADIEGNPEPSSEIEEVKWLDTTCKNLKIGSVLGERVMPKLIKKRTSAKR